MEPVQAALWVVILLVVLALLFDFMNGFHDAANSIATVVSTGFSNLLRPWHLPRSSTLWRFRLPPQCGGNRGQGYCSAGHR